MDEDFIRCYIGDITFSTFQNIQRESNKFDEWELFQGLNFDRKQSYGYQKYFDRAELLLDGIAKRSVIAENRKPEDTKPSLLWNNALNIADVLTFLSIARARYYPILAVEKHLGDKYTIGWGLMTREIADKGDIVSLSNLGRFISQALTFIGSNPTWLEESGFIPSLYWFQQAQISRVTAPSILEMGLYWVSLEILAGVHNDSNGLGIINKKELVKRFIHDKGYSGDVWGFLDEVIDDWYAVRNDLFHEGKQKLSIGLLSRRRQQIRDFTSLVFVEMLQKQEDARKNEIATRMQNY